jgi:hypothetical protein
LVLVLVLIYFFNEFNLSQVHICQLTGNSKMTHCFSSNLIDGIFDG